MTNYTPATLAQMAETARIEAARCEANGDTEGVANAMRALTRCFDAGENTVPVNPPTALTQIRGDFARLGWESTLVTLDVGCFAVVLNIPFDDGYLRITIDCGQYIVESYMNDEPGEAVQREMSRHLDPRRLVVELSEWAEYYGHITDQLFGLCPWELQTVEARYGQWMAV